VAELEAQLAEARGGGPVGKGLEYSHSSSLAIPATPSMMTTRIDSVLYADKVSSKM
jgi:hypothetical protein